VEDLQFLEVGEILWEAEVVILEKKLISVFVGRQMTNCFSILGWLTSCLVALLMKLVFRRVAP
jgi:hypothetical protein